jgi:hypothetical protein
VAHPRASGVIGKTKPSGIGSKPDCYPTTDPNYADWVALGKPACWCAPPYGSGYQCDGDADGKDSGGLTKFRVFTKDLSVLVTNWQKKDAQLPGNCPKPDDK